MKLFNPFYFILSLCFGILLVYLFNPIPEVIIKYPDKNTIYEDKSNTCYKYIEKEIQCPLDGSKVKEFNLQNKKDNIPLIKDIFTGSP